MTKKLIKLFITTTFLIGAAISFAADIGKTIEATTATGDKVVLNPNGRWEYLDAQKAAEASAIAKQYPENNVCPPGSQGGWFGTRCILPDDPAFNRKSRIGK
jgi:hypothetical protein